MVGKPVALRLLGPKTDWVQQTFSYHRTVAPMLWAFVALATIEMLVVHLFITLRWPAVGWPLLLASATSVLWMVHWIRSMSRYPHTLTAEALQVRTGSLRLLKVPLASIDRLMSRWPSGDHKGAGAINTVPLAHPNRMLRLNKPIKTRKGMCQRIALRVDDPIRFDEVMAKHGIVVD